MEKSLCKMGCEGNLGNSLLHYAAQYGHIEMVAHLIQNGNSARQANQVGETPLHLAAGAHLKSIGVRAIEMLLDNGAELNARNAWGDTAAHYAARTGTSENLKFLIEEGISLEKVPRECTSKACRVYCGNNPDEEEEMRLTFLQKIAKSQCLNKAFYVIDRIMEARMLMIRNQEPKFLAPNRFSVFNHVELSQQQVEFKKMADELRRDMSSPNSPVKLFLKYCPEAIEYLFDKCVIPTGGDQIQGKVFFDFFMLYPTTEEGGSGAAEERSPTNSGELRLLETLIESRKERFLTHPVFETFLKLKWYRTRLIYFFIVLLFAVFVAASIAYAIVHFAEDAASGDPVKDWDGWAYFLAITSAYVSLTEVVKITYVLSKCARYPAEHAKRIKKDATLGVHLVFMKCRELIIPFLPFFVLYTDLDFLTKKYIMALTVILACHSLMLSFSRLPTIGMYIFMLNKVFSTILTFFVSYFWHFLGYAIAFHILMPKEGGFSTLGNSIIKVSEPSSFASALGFAWF